MKKKFFILLLIFSYSCGHCPDASGSVLNGGSLVQKGDRVRWKDSSFPIKIYPNTSVPFTLIRTQEAAQFINRSIGHTVFVVDDSISDSQNLKIIFQNESNVITIDKKELGESKSGGEVMGKADEFLFYDGAPRYTKAVKIFIDNDLEYSIMARTIVHELGHALGLAHDPNDKRSIMFNNVIEDMTFFQYLMPDDIDYIKIMMGKLPLNSI